MPFLPLAALVTLSALLAGVGAGVGAPPGAETQTDRPTDPHEIVHRMREAYRAGPVAERMLVTLADASGEVSRQRISLRLDARDPARTVVAIELGRVRVIARGERIAVTHLDNPRSVWRARLGGPPTPARLGEVLGGPVPAPQLSLAFGEGVALPWGGVSEWTGVEWSKVADGIGGEDPGDGSGRVTLLGRLRGAPLVLHVDARTWRVHSLMVDLEGPAKLELAVERVPAGEPATWGEDLAGRREVGSLDMLLDEVGPVEVGMRVPEISLLTLDRRRWSLREAHGEGESALALLFVRTGGEAGLREGVLADVAAGVGAWEAAGGDMERLYVARVAGLREMGPSFMVDLAEFWRSIGVGTPLLWTPDAEGTIDHFSRHAEAVLAVVGAEGVLLGRLSLDGRAGEGEAIARELRALGVERGGERAPEGAGDPPPR